MKKMKRISRLSIMATGVLLGICLTSSAFAAITPVENYLTSTLADPSPPAFAWNSAIAYYENSLIYVGEDGKVYAYVLDTGASTLVSDTSGLATAYSAVSGLLVTSDQYLYFHDNGNSAYIYRVGLTDEWPAPYESLDTGIGSSIFTFAQNPWTNAIWFASADFFGSGNNMYLYEVNGFESVTQWAAFASPNGGGNGPIIFKGRTTLLYGESTYMGDGFFHLVDSAIGEIVEENYLSFSGGLAAACYGYDNDIYATTGNGKTIFEINGSTLEKVASTDDAAQGITFDGTTFYVSEMDVEGLTGAVRLDSLWRNNFFDDSGGGGGCFISTVSP